MKSINTNIIAQFIPIILIFILLSYFKPFVIFSHTIIGKLIAVMVIIFYTYIDKVMGLFVCALIIFYYQTDYIENLLKFYSDKTDQYLLPVITKPNENIITEIQIMSKHNDIEQFTEYNKLYNDNDIVDNSFSNNRELQDTFRKQYCESGVLKHKNIGVNNEYAEHVFPEIKFKNNVCNPCSSTCGFSIIESKMKIEETLNSKSSKNR